MSDLSVPPLSLAPLKAAAEPWHWPTPPFAGHLAGDHGWMSGRSVGHVRFPHGVFLLPPTDDRGSVQRVFVPSSTYSHSDIGPRIGELLVEQRVATPEQIDAAVVEQTGLRART